MKSLLKLFLVILFGAICTSSSAQWYKLDFKKNKTAIRPEAELLTVTSVARLPAEKIYSPKKISPVIFGPTEYSLLAAEGIVMREAQHNMRFRVYHDASYNFSELAHLYVQENRLSEAKWYLLQSNNISRQENDDKHTITNLIELATIKNTLGEVTLAQDDLTEAHDLATSKGFSEYIETIDLAMQYIKQNKLPKQRPVLIYADGAQNKTKAE